MDSLRNRVALAMISAAPADAMVGDLIRSIEIVTKVVKCVIEDHAAPGAGAAENELLLSMLASTVDLPGQPGNREVVDHVMVLVKKNLACLALVKEQHAMIDELSYAIGMPGSPTDRETINAAISLAKIRNEPAAVATHSTERRSCAYCRSGQPEDGAWLWACYHPTHTGDTDRHAGPFCSDQCMMEERATHD